MLPSLIAAYSAYKMFSWYNYLIVSLVFSHLGFWSGNLFLIAPFPDLCLLVPLNVFTTVLIVFRPQVYRILFLYTYQFHLGASIGKKEYTKTVPLTSPVKTKTAMKHIHISLVNII